MRHPCVSHIKQEYQGRSIQKKICNQRNYNEDLDKAKLMRIVDSKLSGLRIFDNISLSCNIRMVSYECLRHFLWSNFCYLQWELVSPNKQHATTSGISTTRKISAKGTLTCARWLYNYPIIFICCWRTLLVLFTTMKARVPTPQVGR